MNYSLLVFEVDAVTGISIECTSPAKVETQAAVSEI